MTLSGASSRPSAAARPGWSSAASCWAPATCCRSSASRRRWRTPRDPGRFDTAFGYYTFAASLGQAVGPALITLLGGGGALPDTAPIFATATGLGVVLLACTAFLRMPARERATGDAARGGMGTLLRLPGLVRALVISCVVLSAVDITLVYLPALGTDRGLAAGVVGLLLTLRAVASMTSRFFLGRLVRLSAGGG